MRGHVSSRGPINPKTGKHEGPPYTVSVELGEQPARRCPACVDGRPGRRLYWLDEKPPEKCPVCSGELEAVRERRQKTKGGYLLKREADAALVKQLDARNEGTYRPPSNLSTAEFMVDKWLPAIEHSVAASTYASYEGHVYQYLVPALGDKLLRQLDTSDVDVFYGVLAKTPGGRGGRCLSAKTRRNVHITLRNALGYAVSAGLINANPAAAAKKPKLTRTQMHTWTSEQLRTFLGFVADDPWAGLWRVYASTGLRRGEALGLRWSDVDFEHGRLRVERSLNSEGYKVVVGSTKTGRGRNISMDPWTVKGLKKLRAEQTLALGSAPSADAWVFTGKPGEPLHPNKVTARFKVLREKLNAQIVKAHAEAEAKGDAPVLPHIRLHDLRHTWATLALEAGVHVLVVSKQLGHAKVAITMDTYSHVSPQLQEDASERVAALFSA